MRSLAALLALTLAVPALAVPMQLTHQGVLADSAGLPLEGAHQLTVAIFAQASGGSALWSDTLSATLDQGAYSVILGAGAPLEAELFDGSVRYVELSVDGGSPLPQRLPITSVPYAVLAGQAALATEADHAATADALTGGIAWDDITGAPEDADTLGDLACDDGEVPTWAGGAWSCASPTPAVVDVGTLTGTISVDNLPVGTSSGSVAAGDHTHGFGQITGQAAYAQLPVGTSANTVAAGDHTHTAAQVGALPIGGGTLTGGLTGTDATFSGTVRVGGGSASCGTSNAGALRYSGGDLHVCDGSAWKASGAPTVGTAPTFPGASCKDIKARFPAAPSGVYWVDVNGGGTGDAFQVYCDQVTDGGGWTLVQQAVPVVNNTIHLCQAGAIGSLDFNDTAANTPAKLANATINSLWSADRELLVKYDEGNTQPGSAVWDKVCVADFRSTYNWHTQNNVSNFNDLDDTSLRCLTGSHATLNTIYTNPSQCGFGFSRGNADNYFIQAFDSTYAPAGSTCITTANAGRSWLGPGNNGCNMTKYYVR